MSSAPGLVHRRGVSEDARVRVARRREVTYACCRCALRVTEERAPGPAPRYCAFCLVVREEERTAADRAAARLRMRRLRARRAQAERARLDRWLSQI